MSESLQTPPAYFAEVQGLFGPVTLSERVFQKIWHRGEFRSDALFTSSGKRIEIVSRGRWNKLGGPDFLDAELRFDGKRVLGDIEFHFYAEDWFAHGHDKNPEFGNVVLHVLLFPPKKNFPEKNARGNAMETLLLLPHLTVDVEEYASSEAISALEGRAEADAALEILLEKSPAERDAIVEKHARERYAQKVRFMQKRLERASWEQTLHEVVLETLGLKRNRTPMSRLALKFSPSAMLLAGTDALLNANAGTWHLSGVRPANHPRARLEQYLKLLEKNPAWTRKILEAAEILPASGFFSFSGKMFRTAQKLPALRQFFAEEIFAGSIGGTRFETLMCDAVFPLMAAKRDVNLFPLWFHWFVGDAPAKTLPVLRAAELVSRERPLCNGSFQALLQIFLTRRETERE